MQRNKNHSTSMSAWLDDGKKTPKRRRGLLYELFVLGELNDGPHHGYLLREILTKILGPFRQISWGSLYPLIHRLEEAGLITQENEETASHSGQSGRRGQRNHYRITDAGREQFQTLMNEPVPHSSYDSELFIVKLNYFDSITSEEQLAILQYHQAYITTQTTFIQENLHRAIANEHIPEPERKRIEWVTGFRLSRIEAEATWIDTAITNLQAGKIILSSKKTSDKGEIR